MKIYIRSIGNISPDPTTPPAGNRLKAVEPDYTAFIDPKSIRRMSRIVKMGVAAAYQCLREAGLEKPDAIVTGTAYGCLEDTGIFLSQLIRLQEEMLSPTSFIQSTHNTVGAQIALMLQCTGYNNTFVHRGFSFESALLDGMMLLQEGAARTVLVGGLDEITDASHAILERFGLYKHGAVAGEGATFFLLTAEPSGKDFAVLEGLATFYKPATTADMGENIRRFLSGHSTKMEDINPVLTGAGFKHFCGEYPTASAFALALAARMAGPKKILIHNNYLDIHHSLMLITKC
jgi:3-oxoacyl-[acyl-carrier-protein] synthase II